MTLGIALAILAGGAARADGPPAARETAAAAAGAPLRVGEITLHPCGAAAWCGPFQRPLDPAGRIKGAIPIYFEFYPHARAGPAAGTLVAAEGGPGYPTTDSRDEYLALFAPLRETYDVLLMDYRGTGRSGAIDCPELQRAPQLTEQGIGDCGASLGQTAPLYSTSLAADDLEALLAALGRGRIGLYGDSYGTYFAQVFALRHPERLRSLVLDGAYPLSGPDYAWYPNIAPAMRRKFDVACERAPGCRAIPGSSMEHIAPALKELRAHPFDAHVRHGDGRVMDFTADASALAILMYGGYPAYATVRELDAAARAFTSGDRAPLLRLMAETFDAVESRDPTANPVKFSAGLAAAVMCQDPPHIFDMHLPPDERAGSRDRIIAERKASAPDTYAPFTLDEYRRMPLDFAYIDQCVRWPAAVPGSSALTFEGVNYPGVPVLVISGELDDQTSMADGEAAAERYPHSRHVGIVNSFHVNALPHARSACAAGIVRRFMADLEPGDVSCAAAVPPVPLVTRFARHLQELDPAAAAQGNESDPEALRAVSAALLACADAITRAAEKGGGEGLGLRGGAFTAARQGEGYRLTLREVRWTEDLAVSGRVEWPGRAGVAHAQLELHSGRESGRLELSWPEGVNGARATATGTFAGKAVAAEAAAP
jgi:pimeloyl-ACP methyl ester carboxylesterase